MLRDKHIAVVIPAFNEARWIADVVRTLPDFVDMAVVVDDASRDDTAARARTADGRVEVLRRRHNGGVGAAIRAGYAHAHARGADVLAVMAGDGQMDPADLRAVVEPVATARADYVKGDRLGHPEAWASMPLERLLGSHVLSALTSAAIGQPVRDSQCGYTALSRQAYERIDPAALWPGYGYPNDLLAALARSGARIEEVVVRPVYRGEHSGLRPRHVTVIAFLCARAGWRRLVQARP